MRALVVTESLFGNTLAIAEAVAEGICSVLGSGAATVLHASRAPAELPSGLELLVIGAPTHTLSLPDAGTRREAARLGGATTIGPGVREWIAAIPVPAGLPVATFDTSIPGRERLGNAARAAAEALAERGANAVAGPSFWVSGLEGPLADGELARATEWGESLVIAQQDFPG